MNCAGPGCTFPLDPDGPSPWFHADLCQANYNARAVDRVWAQTGEVISEEIRASLARSTVEEGPDPLTHVRKVSD